MSKQASPTLIGSFVVGAVALIVGGVLIFGSGKFFSDTVSTVMYFQGDLKGLQVGALVAYEGVSIGTVTGIGVYFDSRDYSARTPVIAAIRREHFHVIGDSSQLPAKGQVIKVLVEQKGLRAQLQSESMVTGQLFIQLAFHPEVPPTQLTIDPLTNLPEIPTVPTTLQAVQDTVRTALVKINELPLEDIITNLNATLQGINQLVNSPEVTKTVRELQTTLTDAQHLLRNMDKQLGVAVASVGTTMSNVNKLTGDLSKLTQNVNGRVPEMMTSISDAAKSAQHALAQAQQTLGSVNGAVEPNSPIRYEMVRALRDLSEAARAMRALADYLDRYPNSVVFGRSDGEAK